MHLKGGQFKPCSRDVGSTSHLQILHLFFFLKWVFTHCPFYQIATPPPPSSLYFWTSPLSFPLNLLFLLRALPPPAVWLWVFWLSPDVDQTPVKYWTSHSIQSSFFFFFSLFFFSPRYSVLGFPFCCVCILCTWSAGKIWMKPRFNSCRNVPFLNDHTLALTICGIIECFLKMYFLSWSFTGHVKPLTTLDDTFWGNKRIGSNGRFFSAQLCNIVFLLHCLLLFACVF